MAAAFSVASCAAAGLSVRVVDPAPSSDGTVATEAPAIQMSGIVEDAGGPVQVLWESNRGFSGLAVLNGSPTLQTWRTSGTIPLRPGLNHIRIRVFDSASHAAETAVNIFSLASSANGTSESQLKTGFYKGRPVTYAVVGGRAIYQGDIVLGRAADIPDSFSPSLSAHRGTSRAGAPSIRPDGATITYFTGTGTGLWPISNGVGRVPYTISSRDQGVPSVVDNIDSAVSTFNSQLAGVVQFLPATGSDTNYAEFDFDPSVQNGICETTVGYQAAGAQVIGGAINCTVPTILHEMGHVIGLWHEQSRQDRNTYVNFLYANVDKPNASNFDQLTDNEADSGLYNYASLMHYVPFAFSRDGVSPTLESIPAGIPLSSTLPMYTTGDLDAIQRLYGFAPTSVTIDSNPTGLSVIVDGATVTAPQTFAWTAGSQHTLSIPSGAQTLEGQNYIFGRWNLASTDANQTITVAPGDGSLLKPSTSPAITAYLASFIPIHIYNPTVFPGGGGSITSVPTPSTTTVNGVQVNYYEDRQPVTLTVTANSGLHFYDWFQANLLSYYANPYSFYVQSDLSALQAVLVSDPVTSVSAAAPDLTAFGTFPGFAFVVDNASTYYTPKNFDATYDGSAWSSGHSHHLCATFLVSGTCPSTNLPAQSPVTTNITYGFTKWTGSSSSTANSLAIRVSGNQTFTANYTGSFRSIVLASPNCGGNSITPSTGGGYLDEFFSNGTVLGISAVPGSGFSFAGWSGDLTGTANPANVTISNQLLGTANFNSTGTSAPLAITSFSPGSAPVSPNAIDVTVNGTGFTSNSAITFAYFNGIYRNVTYTSSTQLTVHLQAGDLAVAGYFPIGIYNAGTSCGAYVQKPFVVTASAGVPVLALSKSHTGNFAQGQQGATYSISVSNTGAGATDGTAVDVTDMVPSGLTLVSMTGTGWTCAAGSNSCTRSDTLNPGTSYPAITVTVNVKTSASSPQVNQASVTGGGSGQATASDSTTVTQTPASVKATGGTPQSAVVNTSFAKPLQATVKDAGGHAIAGVTVTFTAPTTGASARLSAGTATTNAQGIASVTARANAKTGSYSVKATVTGVAAAATFALTNTASQ